MNEETLSENIEKSKWDTVNDLIRSTPDWEVDPAWHQSFINYPNEMVSYFSKCKFALKIATSHGCKILEIGCQHAMGAPILSEKASEYYGLDELEKISGHSVNLKEPKFHFSSKKDLNESVKEEYFDSLIAINSSTYHEDQEFYLKLVKKQGKFLAFISPNDPNLEDIKSFMENSFVFTTAFFFNNEVMQCGFSKSADYIAFLGCSKK